MLKKFSKILFVFLFSIFSANIAHASCTATGTANIAAKIAAGHAYNKHVVTAGEFKAGKVIAGLAMPASPVVNSIATFQSLIQSAMGSATNRGLSAGRKAYWHAATGTIVIYDPAHVDCGTSFRPIPGKSYYDTTT
jgi:hypothetical protein